MSQISDQLKDIFKNSLPEIDEEWLNNSVQETVRECSAITTQDRASLLKIAIRLYKYTGWKIWLVQGLCLIAMLSLFIGLDELPVSNTSNIFLRGLCVISVTIPFITIPFIYRSFSYRMNEMEMSTYASYGIQLLIKLSVIGIGDLVMLISGFLVAIFALNIQTTAVLIYGMFPFLLFKTIVLYVLSHYHILKTVWIYGAIYVTFIVAKELFIKYYPLDSTAGLLIIVFAMGILCLIGARSIKEIACSARYQEHNIAR